MPVGVGYSAIRNRVDFFEKIRDGAAVNFMRRRNFHMPYNHMHPSRRRCFYLAIGPIAPMAANDRFFLKRTAALVGVQPTLANGLHEGL